jgi:putative colanic acid biosynthesis acetyltransferase WcaF
LIVSRREAAAITSFSKHHALAVVPPLSLANKVGRGLWNVVWLVLYRPTPRLFHPWRRFVLRLFGARIGKAVRAYPSARVWAPWNLEMGDHSCLGDWVDCYSVDKIRIGAHATVSQYSFLCTASHDYTDPSMPLVTAPISIGEHAWVTADVFVAPGVSIGDGAVILARSSVFGDIAPWVVAAGNPAQPLKRRAWKAARAPESTAS